MRRMIIVLLMFISYASQAQTRSIQNLIGKWEAVGKTDESGGLEVVDSSKIFLVYGDEKMQVVSYDADFTKTPAWFDFTVKDSIKQITIKSLLQFVNDDLVQWQVFDGETRPVIFAADRGEMVYLKRKK